jgi:hypothetical protein
VATIKAGFNERIYEFCVNFELVSSIGALIAGYVPGIPSPQDEADLGWDAAVSLPAFGTTFLLQYKVAKRTTARAGANARFWDVYDDEYFRFILHRDAAGNYAQHQLLLNADATGAQALYCAPLMHTRGDLVHATRIGKVIERSTLIPVADLGPAVGFGPHSVSYPVDERSGLPTLHSEPSRGKRVKLDDLERSRAERRRPLDLKQAIPGVRGRFTGRDRPGEASTRLWGAEEASKTAVGVLRSDPDGNPTCGRRGWGVA